MAMAEIQRQVLDSAQSPAEVRKFIADFCRVRLTFLAENLHRVEARLDRPEPPLPQVDWQDEVLRRWAGIDPAWVAEKANRAKYVHPAYLEPDNWSVLAHFLRRSCLSDKQQGDLFPFIHRQGRAAELDTPQGASIIAEELRTLNGLLHEVDQLQLDYRAHERFLGDVSVHGSWQNLSGGIGIGGAVIAILDALANLGILIVDMEPRHFLTEPFTNGGPVEFFHRKLALGTTWYPRAILLNNGKAVLFNADPDIAILQPLQDKFVCAADAMARYEKVRKDLAGRRLVFHEYAVGEVKTATDLANLHERAALGNREDQAAIRTIRFLMMAVIIADILTPTGNQRRRQQSLVNSLGTSLSDIFNLYFVWGYDGARERHAGHWHRFVERMRQWCG